MISTVIHETSNRVRLLFLNLKFIFLSLFLYFAGTGLIMAQQETIINTLELSDDGAGRIVVKSDPAITALIGKPSSKVKSDSDNYDIVKANGFRVLVFLGNDPKKSRSEAFARQNLIKTTFIDMATYIDYDAPNWKVLAGDFVTREDATLFKEKLQKEFPQFGKEIYIINDKINLFIEK